MMPNLALWSEFLSFFACQSKFFSLCHLAQKKTKISTMKYHVMMWKRGKNINSKYIWKSLLDLIGDVFYLCPLQLMIRSLAGVSFLCKQSTEETWITWVERRRCPSYLSTGIVWFTISVPALGIKMCHLSSYFPVVCFHAFSRYSLLISHGLGLAVQLSWCWLCNLVRWQKDPKMRGSVYSTHNTSSSLYAWCRCEHVQKEEVWFPNTYLNKTPSLWLWKGCKLTCRRA